MSFLSVHVHNQKSWKSYLLSLLHSCGTEPLTRGFCANWPVSVIPELQGIQLVSREWENWLVWETPAHIWSQMCSKKGTQRFPSYLVKMKM